MGGRPLLALNIVGFPVDLPKEILGRILQGGGAKAQEAGVLVIGGHTVDDAEPKYGMAVTGTVEPGKQITNAGAKPGDALVITKPIGTGIITTAGKREQVSADVLDNAVAVMSALNQAASEAMVEVGVHACVDVTGFGLIGHLLGMLNASNASAEVSFRGRAAPGRGRAPRSGRCRSGRHAAKPQCGREFRGVGDGAPRTREAPDVRRADIGRAADCPPGGPEGRAPR